MKGIFLYPKNGMFPCPHPVHLAWGKSVCGQIREVGLFGGMDKPIPENTKLIVMESLRCLVAAKRFKDKHPDCKVVAIVADTSFLPEKLSFFRELFYAVYLKAVDLFVCESNKISKDVYNYIDDTVKQRIVVVRPYAVNLFKPVKKEKGNRRILFIGGNVKSKGFLKAIEAMQDIPEFYLTLVGSCCDGIPARELYEMYHDICVAGKVDDLMPFFALNSYYLHPADFDACPVTVWEAMHAGLIPIITKNVGQADVFDGELKRLVLEDNDPQTIAAKMKELDALSKKKKDALRKEGIELAHFFGKENSIRWFKNALRENLA